MTGVTLPRRARAALGVTAGALACALSAAPAQAEIPPAVDAMIREAARSGDKATLDAVAKVAKATNPDEADAIDALATSLLAQAQAKAEQEHHDKLAAQGFFEGWVGEGQLGVGLTGGNTDETSAVLGIKFRRQGLHTRQKLDAVIDYLRSNGVTTREKFAVGYSNAVVITDGLSVVGTLGWERDRFAGQARRFTESLGLGYRLINARRMTLDLEAAPALRQTRYVGGVEEDEFAARGSLAYRWKLKDGLALSQDASVVSGGSDTTLISTSALTARINGKLSGRMSFNVQSETDPQPGRTSTDTTTRATLVYEF